MDFSRANEVFIWGVTQDGRPFRPSDWAERLAGVMSRFRPGGAQPESHLSYSPWCMPLTNGGLKCVVVRSPLREHEPMAWDFVIRFALDNGLQVTEACLLPERSPGDAPDRSAHATPRSAATSSTSDSRLQST